MIGMVELISVIPKQSAQTDKCPECSKNTNYGVMFGLEIHFGVIKHAKITLKQQYSHVPLPLVYLFLQQFTTS